MPGAGLSLDASHHTSEARGAPTAKGWSQRMSLPDIRLFPGFLPQDRVKPHPVCTVVLAEVAARRSSITQIVVRMVRISSARAAYLSVLDSAHTIHRISTDPCLGVGRGSVRSTVVRHEALLFRAEVEGLRGWPVVAGR